MTFFGGQFDNINILQLNPPRDPSFSLTNGTCAYCSPGNPAVATIRKPIPRSLEGSLRMLTWFHIPPDGKHPDLYLETWNLTVSKQFWDNVLDIAWVGVKGKHQDTSLAELQHWSAEAVRVRPTSTRIGPILPLARCGYSIIMARRCTTAFKFVSLSPLHAGT